MIVIRQEDPGTITIDATGERSFDFADDGAMLLMALTLRELREHEAVVDDGGQPGQVLSYVDSFFANRGLIPQLTAPLARLLASFRSEQEKVTLIRAGSLPVAQKLKVGQLGIIRDLLPHQQRAARHALSLDHAANFSVPGSGKTQSALAAFAAWHRADVVQRMLVVGPASCFSPWEDEYREVFGTPAKSLRLTGTPGVRAELLRDVPAFDLVLCTYQMASREKANLTRMLQTGHFLFILDESHHVKNILLGPWSRTVLDLAPFAERRLILTGTPAPHSLADLWTQFTFLWPSQAVLGPRAQYESKLDKSVRAINAIKKDIAPFFIRTTKSELGLPKPKPLFVKIPYKTIPERQRLIIRLLELRTLQEVKRLRLQRSDVELVRRWRRARTLRLLQAASNPALLRGTLPGVGEFGDALDSDPALAALLRDYDAHETPAKVAYVIRESRRLIAAGEKVVIWATFIDNLLLLERLLSDLRPLKVYGGVPAFDEESDPDFENRERNIRDFKTLSVAERPVLIANPAACAESVSLHRICHHAIYLERTFNCGQFLQSMDRIHRVGMPRHVRPVYHIPLIECAVEQILDRRLRDRQRVLYHVLNDDMAVLGFEDESFLVDREDDLAEIIEDLLTAIRRGRNAGRHGPRRPVS
jgi:SNF2 family DNA or RNA helicase